VGVSAMARDDVWAVGHETSFGTNTLVLHWDGTSWSRVQSPGVNGYSLSGVDALSATDAWAVGNEAIRWTGHDWVQVGLPIVPGYWSLIDVSASSSSRAWAVGRRSPGCHPQCGPDATLIVRWNGTSWSQVSSPGRLSQANFLSGVAAHSRTDVWAVGKSCSSFGLLHPCAGVVDTLIEHSGGRGWTIQSSPNPSSTMNTLADVDARSVSDAWAVGSYTNDATGAVQALVLHWNGTRWSKK
jgi:hypothetical protein